eukprot:g4138.t1
MKISNLLHPKNVENPGGLLLLDGGFSTHCEAKGANLSIGKLWSARLIKDDPALISAVHLDFLQSGAECISTATYQCTVAGYIKEFSDESKEIATSRAQSALREAVQLAKGAVETFWMHASENERRRRRNRKPVVAASIGPYGAFLGGGAEYNGSYANRKEGGGEFMSVEALKEFHRRQVSVLSTCDVDFLLFETIPAFAEAKAIVELLSEFPSIVAVLSFSCKDGERLCSGESFAEAIKSVALCPQIIALGVNCSPPQFVHNLLLSASKVTDKPLLASGNSGESWDRESLWSGDGPGRAVLDYAAMAKKWISVVSPSTRGLIIGGCCRTTPEHITALSDIVQGYRNKIEKSILLVGLICLDNICLLDKYPEEDSAVRSIERRRCCGGNASNSGKILSQLGRNVSVLSAVAGDDASKFCIDSLNNFGVDTSLCPLRNNETASLPTSYILLSKETGTRTIVHHRPREMSELRLNDFETILPSFQSSNWSWIHFEGRVNCTDLSLIMKKMKEEVVDSAKKTIFSLELEKPTASSIAPDILPLVDVVFVSKEYATSIGCNSAKQLLEKVAGPDSKLRPGACCVCPWSEKGASAAWRVKNGKPLIFSSPAFPPPVVVDTIGAGDTFIAAFIDAFLSEEEQNLGKCVEYACQIAGKFVGVEGFQIQV